MNGMERYVKLKEIEGEISKYERMKISFDIYRKQNVSDISHKRKISFGVEIKKCWLCHLFFVDDDVMLNTISQSCVEYCDMKIKDLKMLFEGILKHL